MIELIGSPKQIAFASRIRNKEIKELQYHISCCSGKLKKASAKYAEELIGETRYYQWIIDMLGEIEVSAQIIEEAQGIATRALLSNNAIINGCIVHLDTGEVGRVFDDD